MALLNPAKCHADRSNAFPAKSIRSHSTLLAVWRESFALLQIPRVPWRSKRREPQSHFYNWIEVEGPAMASWYLSYLLLFIGRHVFSLTPQVFSLFHFSLLFFPFFFTFPSITHPFPVSFPLTLKFELAFSYSPFYSQESNIGLGLNRPLEYNKMAYLTQHLLSSAAIGGHCV